MRNGHFEKSRIRGIYASNAAKALQVYADQFESVGEDCLEGILRDLMFYCEAFGEDFDKAVERAKERRKFL